MLRRAGVEFEFAILWSDIDCTGFCKWNIKTEIYFEIGYYWLPMKRFMFDIPGDNEAWVASQERNNVCHYETMNDGTSFYISNITLLNELECKENIKLRPCCIDWTIASWLKFGA